MSLHSSTRNNARHPLIAKVWLLTGVVAIADFIFGATFVSFMRNEGLSAIIVGALLSITGVTSVLFEAPSGAWGDRFGHKRLVTIGLALWGAGFIVFACSNVPWLFAIAIAMWGAGLAFYSGAATALLINTLNANGLQSQATASVRGSEIARWSAGAAGAVIVGLTAWAASTSLMIIIAGGLLALASLWVALDWPESPRREPMSVRLSLAKGIRFITGNQARLLVVFSVLTSVDLAVVILTWQPITLEIVKLSEATLGFMLLGLIVATTLGAGATRWSNRIPHTRALAGALILLNFSLLLIIFGPLGAIAAMLGAEFFLGIALTTLAIWGQQIFPDTIRATATSLLGAVTGLTIGLTNAGMGTLWDGIGLQTAVSAAALAIVVAMIIIIVTQIIRKLTRRHPATTSEENPMASVSLVR